VNPVFDAIFGNQSAAQALLFIEAYGSGHASRMASTFDIPLTGIYRQLRRLEANGVLTSRTVGRTRLFEFNTRNPTVRRLRGFLASELQGLPDDELKKYYRQRQRPRRTGKGS
jgi:sugar-specific transcriptional regulator TrmB